MGAVIWCVIVIVWAAVLIPMWLRRHDETGDGAADKFASAVRVLTRRSGSADRGRSEDGWLGGTRRPARRRASLPVRRSRRLLALLGAAAVTALAAFLSVPGALALHVITDVAVIAYAVHLRQAVRCSAKEQAAQDRRIRSKAAVTTWDALLGDGTMPGISPEVPAAHTPLPDDVAAPEPQDVPMEPALVGAAAAAPGSILHKEAVGQ